MLCKRRMLMAVAAPGLLALTPFLLFAQNAASPQEETAKLIALLKSDAPVFDKAKACQRLAVIGTKEAVPVLAGLLADEKLAHYARFGLEPIPDASVDDALRQAMRKLKGTLRVGVINSIGVRRDVKAQGALMELLGDADTEVAAAAAAALGRIGTPRAAKALRQALHSAGEALRPAVAQAALPCAEALLALGQRDEAVALYEAVRQAKLPEHVHLAALRGAILARQAGGVPLLIEKLQGKGLAPFALALSVAREMPGRPVTHALVAEIGKLPPVRQAMVIQTLGDRGDGAALPAVLTAARDGPAAVRIAAIRALSSVGDASAVPVLLDVAAQSEGPLAQAAQSSLASLRGKEVDRAIVAMLDRGDRKLRPVLIELVGRRRIVSAVPSLRKAAREADEPTRLAAVQALGETIGLEDLPVLTDRLVDPEGPQETAAVREALKAACARMPDRAACVEKLKESMARAPVEAKCLLLEVFSSVGGPQALEAVSASARDANQRIRDAATRVLGEWKSEDAARELLELVKISKADADRTRALRSFSDLIRRLGFPKEQRLGFCREAMRIARSDDERKLVLHALAGIPAPETFALLTPHLADPGLKEDASSAAVTIAERIVRSKPRAVANAMKQVLQATANKDLAKRAERLLRQAGGKP